MVRPLWRWIVLGLAAFAILAAAILTRPEKRLLDFDQSFYLTIAHDLSRWGVFSNGVFDDVDSTVRPPQPGMFFVPVYPALVYLMMKADPRFERAVVCNVDANEKHRPMDQCEFYARPIHLLHAALLALAVVAVALTAQAVFGAVTIAMLAGGLATAGLLVEADVFSFVMTESVSIALFSFAALAYVMALKSRTARWGLAAGALLGLMVLARPSFVVLAIVWPALLLGWHYRRARRTNRRWALAALAFVAAFVVVLSPWIARNALSVGKASLSEEYGAATLIERFAFDGMTGREFGLAFPYCLPAVGPALVNRIFGPEAMGRFEWDHPGSFFQTGRAHREALVAAHGKLDPLIGGLFRDEMRTNGAGYVMSTLPLGWCGLWVFQVWGLLLVPVFAAACVLAWRRAPLFLLYAGPALVIVGVHAAAANHYPRYNLMLVGPISVGAAWIISRFAAFVSRRHSTESQNMNVISR